jgi:hypothetical protein
MNCIIILVISKTTHIGILFMTSVASKIYLEWGNKVIAVEVYNETPEEFTARTGIVFDEPTIKHGSKTYRPAVSEMVDYGLGEIIERKKGFSALEVPVHKNLAEIASTAGVFIAQSDIEDLSNNSNIPLIPNSGEDVGVEKYMQEYQSGFKSSNQTTEFLGYIEVPNAKEHAVLHNFNTLSLIAAQSTTGKYYVPVFLFDGRVGYAEHEADEEYEGYFFDGGEGVYGKVDIKKLNNEKPYIVMYLGTDNASYGQRFETIEKAKAFIALGFKAGFKDLLFYNS